MMVLLERECNFSGEDTQTLAVKKKSALFAL